MQPCCCEPAVFLCALLHLPSGYFSLSWAGSLLVVRVNGSTHNASKQKWQLGYVNTSAR